MIRRTLTCLVLLLALLLGGGATALLGSAHAASGPAVTTAFGDLPTARIRPHQTLASPGKTCDRIGCSTVVQPNRHCLGSSVPCLGLAIVTLAQPSRSGAGSEETPVYAVDSTRSGTSGPVDVPPPR